MPSIVVIGGGHAAAQLCSEFIARTGVGPESEDWRITVLSQEGSPPYQRPPLSKTFIKESASLPQPILNASFYETNGIDLRQNMWVETVDRECRQVSARSTKEDGQPQTFNYDYLVFATGATPRRPGLLDANSESVEGIHFLHTLADAGRLAGALKTASSVVILGGGFIGLEVAATARSIGLGVTVLEAGSRLLARSVSPEISRYVYAAHTQTGINILLDTQTVGIVRNAGSFVGLKLSDGATLTADLLVVGIGSVPTTALAGQCGLTCENGIVVDETMATNDPRIFAIGDCAAFPHPAHTGRMRLESVQNTQVHAEVLAAHILGQPILRPPGHVPRFWSDQGGVRLQIAGIWQPAYEAIRRDTGRPNAFSLFHFRGEVLECVETANAPGDHIIARNWLASGYSPPREQLANLDISLKSL